MPSFAEVVSQTFRSLTPEAISDRLFGESFESWWQDYIQRLDDLSYKGEVQTAFFIATFTAIGRVSKVDGRIQQAEINLANSVMDHLKLNTQQKRLAVRLFNEGKQADFDLDTVLNRFYRLCRHRVSVMQIFMEIQLQTAIADGAMNQQEKSMLKHISKRLDISASIFNRIKRRVSDKQQDRSSVAPASAMSLADAFDMLSISQQAQEQDIKQAYRRLMSQYHPDKQLAKGASDEEQQDANAKLHQIKRAYELVCKAKRII